MNETCPAVLNTMQFIALLFMTADFNKGGESIIAQIMRPFLTKVRGMGKVFHNCVQMHDIGSIVFYGSTKNLFYVCGQYVRVIMDVKLDLT